jgi:hypothetical protein
MHLFMCRLFICSPSQSFPHSPSGHCGCAKGQFETVKILSARGANLWLRNARGDLPVHEAATSGRIELVEWLLQQKPSHMNSSSNDGRTILHIAAGGDKIDMCKMLIEMGADVNAVYRNAKNVVKTPLDCAMQKGFRSTAKYIQLNGGLPANKLRLSGRKSHAANILPELDDVKPLKFTEIEVSYEQKERRRGSETESESEASRGRHRRKHHRKCSHQRRTSSCSEMFVCHRADEPCEINRSKSSTELHRRRKSSKHHHHHQQNSISTGSSESESSQSDSEDDCCYHIKRKHRCYKRVRSKSRERDGKKGSESSDKDQQQQQQQRAKRDKKKVEIVTSAKKSDSKAATTKGTRNDSKATKAAATNKKRPPSAKPGALQKKGSQEEKNRSIDKPPKTPADEPQPPSIDISNSKKSTTTEDEDKSEDDKNAKEITTRAEVHEAMQPPTDVDEGALTDATYTIERRDKSEIATFEPETIREEATNVGSGGGQESSKKVSFKSDANSEGAPAAVAESAAEDSPEPLPQVPAEQPIEEVVMVMDNSEKEKAFAQLPTETEDSDELPENIQRPKSQTPESVGSFTILEDGDDAEQKLKEFDEMTQDGQQLDLPDDDDSGEQYYDDSSSAEKMPKRFKVLDDGKDQDSGIEPSPRSHRTKIPAPRSTHSSAAAPSVTRRSFLVTDDRPRSTRIEGRKPGDKNACNMTTVTQSIQKNIRR